VSTPINSARKPSGSTTVSSSSPSSSPTVQPNPVVPLPVKVTVTPVSVLPSSVSSTPSNLPIYLEQFQKGLERLATWESQVNAMKDRIADNLAAYKDMSIPAEWGNLDEREQVSIWMYTKQYFRFWNGMLYKGDAKGLQKYEAALAVFKSGLAKLPVYSGAAVRGDGEYKPRHDSHTVGQTFTVKAFWSTTHDRDLLAKTSQFGAGVQYEIASGHQGRLIEFVSESPQEREVLFLPDSQFRISNRDGDPLKKQSVIITISQV
jgi:hypothetical protein